MPYIKALIESGSGILVLSEHWLWPYQLEMLSDISGEYEALGKADRTQMVVGDQELGIGATPISGIGSDRICGIRFTVNDAVGSVMSVVGVYLPCMDLGLDNYRDHM